MSQTNSNPDTHWCGVLRGDFFCVDCGRLYEDVEICIEHRHVMPPATPRTFVCHNLNCDIDDGPS